MTAEQRRHRILVADDVRMLALRIAGALNAQGYETAIATDGQECLDMVKSFQPDLLILDIMMPKMHGVEVLQRLQATDVGVIVCTAKDYSSERHRYEELGAWSVIVKPVETEHITAQVNQYFATPQDSFATWSIPFSAPQPGDEFQHELKAAPGSVRLWGTRGSIPVSDACFLRHGGNTSCMSLEHGGDLLVFDAGSGIRLLGDELLAGGPRKVHLFITHTHWDHIQGFPFFRPAYESGFDITIYGVDGFGKNLESLFLGQLDPDFFPVQPEDMHADLRFVKLGVQPVQIGDVQISWVYVQHPGATVGYRIDTPTASLSWVPDNEFLKGFRGSPFDVAQDSEMANDYLPLLTLLGDVDLLLHECQYTVREYHEKVDWGHSSVSNACLLAKWCRARRWVAVHHDPLHDDSFLQDKLNLTRQLLRELECEIEFSHGYDGWLEYLPS